eukprot:SAG11_NODE_20264_length_449_cov_0.882857_1_plen_60_part_01
MPVALSGFDGYVHIVNIAEEAPRLTPVSALRHGDGPVDCCALEVTGSGNDELLACSGGRD